MSKPLRSRRLIALLAAYVVALQALLLPLTVAAGAAFDGGLCTASASIDGAPPPANHDGGCPCAAGCGMQCCTQALADAPQVALILGPTRIAILVSPPVVEAALPPTNRGPQRTRAPPSA